MKCSECKWYWNKKDNTVGYTFADEYCMNDPMFIGISARDDKACSRFEKKDGDE